MSECMDEKNGCTVIKQYYGCCGGNGNSGTGAENDYSTEETVCGKWIDGKPLYRKVIEGKLAGTSVKSSKFADVAALNIERLIDLRGNFIGDNGRSHIPIQVSHNTPDGLAAAVNMWYNTEQKAILCHLLDNKGGYSNCTAYVVIEYTKQDAATTA